MRLIHGCSKLSLSLAVTAGLVTGCVTGAEDFPEVVDTTMAPLRLAAPDSAIEGQYIVVFEDAVGARSLDAAMSRISLKSASSRIEHTYDIISGFSARLAPEDLDAIRRNPDVAYVEQDQRVAIAGTSPDLIRVDPDPPITITATRPAPGELDMDRHDHCPVLDDGLFNDNGCSGSGVLVYVIDTGIRATHNDFGGRVSTSRGFTAINDGQGTMDCNGHGTHVASTAGGTQFGMAGSATLVPVRVLSCAGSGSVSGLISGINHVGNNCGASERCVAVISYCTGISSTVDSAAANLVAHGIAVAAAAGNSNQDVANCSPGRVPEVITVGCLSDTGYPGTTNSASVTRCSFSNFGSRVDVWASGLSILGADDTSNTATQTISGTSMANAYVAGAIAQMMSCKGNLTPAQVEANLDSKSITGAIANEQGGEDRILCNDWIDADGNACACGGGTLP